MAWHPVVGLLKGAVAAGTAVTVKGWVRTRRDSKAGLSFIHVHDGTCFSPIQVVAPNTLPNYETDVLRLTAGCSVEVDGTLVASEGKGQAFEIKADAVRVVGWVEDPLTYPITAQAPHASSTCARWRTCGRGRTPSAPSPACATAWPRRSTASSTSAASTGSTRRSSPRATPRARARCSASRRSTWSTCRGPSDGAIDFAAGLLRQAGVPHGVGAAERRDVLPGAHRGSTRSGRRSAPRTRTPAATWPSSG